MRRVLCVYVSLLCCPIAFAQVTPNIGLQVPPRGAVNWDAAMNANFTKIDSLLSGNANVPGLKLTGTMTANSQAAYVPTAAGVFGYDSTSNSFVGGNGTGTLHFPYVIGSAPTGCVQWGANYSQIGTGVACGAGGGITGPGTTTNGNIPQWSGTAGNALSAGLGLVTTVGSPGSNTNVPTEQAVRSAIASAGGGNVTSSGTLTSGQIITGAGTTTIQASGKSLPTGAVVGTTDTQTLTGKSIDASEINSGVLSATRLPNPTVSTLGGIQAFGLVASRWISSISGSGVPSATQPGFSDLSGSLAVGQTPLTTSQDILYRNGSVLARLPIVPSGTCLGNAAGVWASVACSGGGGGAATSIQAAAFASPPTAAGAAGVFYDTSGANPGLPLYYSTASGTGSWNQWLVLGTSGGLCWGSGCPGTPGVTNVIDLDTSVVPRLTNSWSQLGFGDFGSASATRPNKTGVTGSIPGTCVVGQTYFETDATAGSNILGCTTTNTWTPQGSGGVPVKSVISSQGSGQTITGGFGDQNLFFNVNVDITDATMHSTTVNPDRFVVPITGYYRGIFNMVTDSVAPATNISAKVVLNASTVIAATQTTGIGAGYSTAIPFYRHLTAGDILTAVANGDSDFTTAKVDEGVTTFTMDLVH